MKRSRKATMIEREKTLGFQQRSRQESGFLRPSKEFHYGGTAGWYQQIPRRTEQYFGSGRFGDIMTILPIFALAKRWGSVIFKREWWQ